MHNQVLPCPAGLHALHCHAFAISELIINIILRGNTQCVMIIQGMTGKCRTAGAADCQGCCHASVLMRFVQMKRNFGEINRERPQLGAGAEYGFKLSSSYCSFPPADGLLSYLLIQYTCFFLTNKRLWR